MRNPSKQNIEDSYSPTLPAASKLMQKWHFFITIDMYYKCLYKCCNDLCC